MIIRKTFTSSLALAIALAFSPLSGLQAATFVSPDSQPGTDKLAQTIKMKKKTYKKVGKRKMGKRKGKRAASRSSHCGTYMYRKKGKCMDARKK
jgi:hypothetical protein